MELEWKEINPEIWKPENPGDTIQGMLIKKEAEVGANNSMLYHINTKDGMMKVWGSKILDDRLTYAKEREFVRITFKEITKNAKNQNLKIFRVEFGSEKKQEEEVVGEETLQ